MTTPKRDWFARPGIWFWSLIALGAIARAYFVVFTQGTYDAGLLQLNSMGVNEMGLLGYYHANPNANHPPLTFLFASNIYRFALFSGIPFPVLLRAPFACLDAGTTLLLFKLLPPNRWRFVLTAAYWINPLAVLLSAYHGNTDSAVAFFILLSLWLLSKNRIAAGGIAMGAGLWIKLPGIVAVPALALSLRSWRTRLLFVSIFVAVAAVGYFLPLIGDPAVVLKNILGYHGRMLQTQSGIAVWGPRVIFFSVIAAPDKWPEQLHAPVVWFLQHNWQIGLVLAFVLILVRRSHRFGRGLCATIAMSYVVLCGVTDYWAFQYFAWSLPLWSFLPPWFYVGATIALTAYIYSLYWTLCGNPWLLGRWDFAAHPEWPGLVIIFRNLAVLFFFATACTFFIAAVIDWVRLRRRRRPATN